MTRFDPTRGHKAPEEWSAIALKETAENNNQWWVAGGITLSALVAGYVSPLSGGIVFAWMLHSCVKRACAAQDNQRAIRDYGCVAQVLEGDNFKGYVRQVGEVAIKEEIKFAHDQGYELSNDALDFYEDNIQPKKAVALPEAIDSEIQFTQEIPNLPEQMAADMKNSLIAGVPGSGKGLFVANALKYVAARGDTTIFYVDPKNDAKETGYFQDVNKLMRLPNGIIASEAIDTYDWLKKCFKEFHSFDARNGRKLLILDEMTSLVKKLANVPAKYTGTVKGDKWLEEEFVTCAAAGDSAGATIWGMAQNGHNTGLGMDGGAKSQMTPIAIVSQQQLSASQALLKADFVPSDKRLSSEEVRRICQKSEVKRAIFHGGLNAWYPMPLLPNPSGYDRDSRSFIQQDAPQAAPSTASNSPQDDYSDADKEQANAAIIAALRTTSHNKLWDFCRDDLGLQNTEEIKEVMEAIANLIFDFDLPSIKDKFNLQSKTNIRYSYSGYSKKVAQTHRQTGNKCCCCLKKESQQVHHSRYKGIDDEPGVNLFPVCLDCHKPLCHSKQNWIQKSIWESCNTEDFESRLKLEFQYAINGESDVN